MRRGTPSWDEAELHPFHPASSCFAFKGDFSLLRGILGAVGRRQEGLAPGDMCGDLGRV